MNTPDYRTINPKYGDNLPRCTEFRYRDRTRYNDGFISWPRDGIITSLWEFRVDFNQLTPEEKAKWFPDATPDYDAMTWEKWTRMTNADKLAFNMPAFEAWAQGKETMYLNSVAGWRKTTYVDTSHPHRPAGIQHSGSIWIKEYMDFSMDVRYSPQEGYTEYRKAVQ